MKDIKRELWLVLGVGLVLRVVYFIWSQDLPFFNQPISDALFHHRWAAAIANGILWDGKPFFKAPLYPYTLGSLYTLFGAHIWIGKVFGHIVGLATGGLIMSLAHHLGGRRTAIIAGALWLASGLVMFFEGELLVDSLFTFLTLLSLYQLLKSEKQPERLVLSGLFLGLAAITRPTILICLPLYVWWLYVRRKQIHLGGRATFALGTLIPLALVAGINSYALERPAGVAMQGGINFYIGNNAEASGFSADLPEPWGYAWNYRQLAAHAEQTTGRTLDAIEVSDYYYGQGAEFITASPLVASKLFLKKTVLTFNRASISSNLNLPYILNRIPLLDWLPVRVWWLFPFALAGLFALGRAAESARFLWLFVVLYSVSLVLFFVTERFRLPIVPLLIVLAALGASTLWDRRKTALPGILAIVAAGFAFTVPNWYDLHLNNEGIAYFNVGNVELRRGQNAAAVIHYDSAFAAAPELHQLRLNRGLAHMRLGAIDLARADFEAEARAFGFDARPHNNLAALHLLMGDTANAQIAIDSGLARDSTLGLLYLQRLAMAESRADGVELRQTLAPAVRLAGDWPVWDYWRGELARMGMQPDSARAAYNSYQARSGAWPSLDGEDLLYAGPGASRTAYQIGLTFLQESRVDSAALYFGEAAMQDSTFAEAWSNWGTAALSVGELRTAQERYRQAIRANPESPVYWTNLAWAHIQASQLDSARTALVQALAVDPGFVPALSLSSQLEQAAKLP